MKFSVSIFLSIILLSNSLRVSVVYGWYVLDVKSFAEQLCENKEKPQLQCNGKCYLTKISKETTKDSDNGKLPQIEWEQLLFCKTDLFIKYDIFLTNFIYNNFGYSDSYCQDFFYSIFHPPQIVWLFKIDKNLKIRFL